MRFAPKGTRLPPSFFNRSLWSTRASFKANKLRAIEFEEIEMRAARAVMRRRLGHASSTDHSVRDRQLVEQALAASRHGCPVGLTFPAARVPSRPADRKLARLAPRAVAGIGEEIVELIRQAEPSVSVELQVRRSLERLRLRNSAGGRAERAAATLTVDIWAERHSGDDVLVVFDSLQTARLDKGHCELAARIAQRLIWADRPATIKAGRMPVILSPAAAATLVQPLVLALSGARVRSKSSPLAGKLGQRLFDARLTITDDGTLPDRPGGTCDHEGVPTQRTVLIRQGVITGFYYDLQSAAQAGAQSTGNGQRDLLSPPRTRPTNIVIEPGASSLEAMLQQAGEGLLVDLVLGAGPAAALRGTVSRTVLLGYKIERGRIAGYVKGVALAGNLYEMLRDVPALGQSGYWSGDIWAPYLLVHGASVSV